MTVNMLVFDYRESEKNFFDTNSLENFDITFFEESLNEETLKQIPQSLIDNTTVISVFVNSEVTKNVIYAFKNLRIISTRSTGLDHINHKAAVEKNIDVINVGSYGAKSVAQYTMGLMLALIRHIVPASQYIQNKHELCPNYVGRDVSQLTMGVIGTGSIGASVCRLAKVFGMKILAYDIMPKQELYGEVEYTDLDVLLKESDVVTLHLPFTGDNYQMIGDKEIRLMKPSSYLINTSRGEILDFFALYDAICEDRLAGAAIDVVNCETINFNCHRQSKKTKTTLYCMKEAEHVKRLTEFPNVIITPHIAYETQDAIDYILKMTFKGIIDCIQGGSRFKNM